MDLPETKIKNGLRVLMIEDEPLVSMMLEEMLEDMGVTVAGSPASLAEALERVQSANFDCALLDMNLGGKRADPVAEQLNSLGVPFAILSGGEDEAKALGASVFVSKPYRFSDIEAALAVIGKDLS